VISYGPWRPDVGGPDSGVAQTADGVLPQSAGQGIGYGPMNSAVTPTGAVSLGSDPRGLITIQRQDGAWQDYAATASKIRVLDSTYDWDDVETGRTVTSGDDVSFALFGTKLLNADTTDGFKVYDYEAGGTNDAVGGGAPTAVRELGVIQNVVFAGDCDGNNRRLVSSALGNHAEWRLGGANGKTFEDGGGIYAIRDLRNGLGFVGQESALRLIQFGNAPGNALYSITKAADGLGVASSRATAAFNGKVHFVANGGGLYEYVAGGEPVAIGDEKVNRWLAGQVAAADLGTIQASVDPGRKITWFRISASLLLGYHWTIREFVTVSVSTAALLRLATPAVVIDDIASLIDDLSVTIDSLDFQGGAPTFGGLGSDLKISRFTGTPLAADLRTCILSAGGSRRFLQATPVSDASNSTLAIYTSDSLATSLSVGSSGTRNEDGNVMLDDRGRRYAFRETIPAGATWTFANGVDDVQSNPDAP
jgi:hypothetical protein